MSTSAQWAATARLVRRAGFGASGTVVDDVVRVGASEWLKQALSADPAADPGAAASPAPSLTVPDPLGKGATREARQARNQQITAANGQLATWWLQRRIAVHNPQEVRSHVQGRWVPAVLPSPGIAPGGSCGTLERVGAC